MLRPWQSLDCRHSRTSWSAVVRNLGTLRVVFFVFDVASPAQPPVHFPPTAYVMCSRDMLEI
jgi:hypothetical protein